MSRIASNSLLQLSVMDRLVAGATGTRSGGATLSELKKAVERDLHELLNTRWRCTSWPPNLKEIENSLVNYGIPDITGGDFSTSEKRREFRAIIERCIKRFEPRFKSVRVELVDEAAMDRVIRFRIDAKLFTEPVPETVVFDTALEPTTAEFEVRRAER